jgi:AraC-like DNA-binding protein
MRQNDITPNANVYRGLDDNLFFVDNFVDLANVQSPRKTEYNLVVLCNKGKILLELGSDTLSFHAGQMCILPSNKMARGMMISPDVNISALGISDKMLGQLLGMQSNIWHKAMYLHKNHVIEAKKTQEVKNHIVALLKEDDTPLCKEITMSLLRTLLLLICRQFMLVNDVKSNVPASDSIATVQREEAIFSQFLDSLSRQTVKRHPVAFYADELCITSRYLASICTHVSGKSPLKWINEYTMDEIYRWLRYTDKSLKEIAMQMGFPSASFFGKFFREQSGMTPIEYRRKK